MLQTVSPFDAHRLDEMTDTLEATDNVRTPRHSWRRRAALVGVLLVAAVGLRAPGLNRPGYTLDEEVTHLAVQGIRTSGLPVLPSGDLYLRALPYTYTAWLGGVLLGHDVVAYRAVSLAFGALTVWLVFTLARRLVNLPAAFLAAVLVSVSPTFMALSQWGRFYSMFIAIYLLTILLYREALQERRYSPWYAVSLVVLSTLHDLSITILTIPAIVYVTASPSSEHRPQARRLLALSAVSFVAVQSLLRFRFVVGELTALGGSATGAERATYLVYPPTIAFQQATPLSFTIVAATIAAIVVALWWFVRPTRAYGTLGLVCAISLQPGLLLLATIGSLLVATDRVLRNLIYGSIVVLVSVLLWSLHMSYTTDALFTTRLMASLGNSALRYPFAAFPWFALTWPVESAVLVMYFVFVARAPRTSDPHRLHAALLAAVLTLIALMGVLRDVALAPRYLALVLPVAYIGFGYLVDGCARFAIDRSAGRRGPSPSRVYAGTMMVTLVSLGGAYAWSYLSHEPTTVGAPRFRVPVRIATIDAPLWSTAVGDITRDEIIVCNDDSACQYMFGRVDYWLAVGSLDRRRWARRRKGALRGYYSGAPVLETLDTLADLGSGNPDATSYIVLSMHTGRFQPPDHERLIETIGARYDGNMRVDSADGLLVVRFHGGT